MMHSSSTFAAPPILWADPARAQAFAHWLGQIAPLYQLDAASVRLASSDASFRRYFRIDALPSAIESFIIMDAPPALEPTAAFVQVAKLTTAAGLRGPEVLNWQQNDGFLLLTDLGQQTMLQNLTPLAGLPAALGETLSVTQQTIDFFMQAIDVLVQWQSASRPGVLPPYDAALLGRELALFPDWYVKQHRQYALSDVQQQTWVAMREGIIAHNLQALGGARVFVHRDFMPRNLMLPLPTALDKRLGVLDFQDAVYGPITYDIASLLRDAFVSWEEEFTIDITVRYWEKARRAGLPVGDDFGAFYSAVEWMGLQRHLKILGIFARLSLRDGKPAYLADTPRFMRYARHTAARYRPLGPLLLLLDAIEGNESRIGYTF